MDVGDLRDAGGQDAHDGAGAEAEDEAEGNGGARAGRREPQAQYDDGGEQARGQDHGEAAHAVGEVGRDRAPERAGRVEDRDEVFGGRFWYTAVPRGENDEGEGEEDACRARSVILRC